MRQTQTFFAFPLSPATTFDVAGPPTPIGWWPILNFAFFAKFSVGILTSLAPSKVFSCPNLMEVHFTPEQQAQIAQVATKAGTVPEQLVTNVVVRYLDEEARFLAAVEKGLQAAARGEFIEEGEMDARLEAMFKH